MKYKVLIALAVIVVSLVAAASVQADTGSAATATPWVYDPDGLGHSFATWETTGGMNVLNLQKNADTSSNEAAGATINGFAGDPLYEVGFDVRGYCGAGAPRINIYSGETTHFFGCADASDKTSLPDGWTHVEFACDDPGADACPTLGPDDGVYFPTIDGGDIVMDEGPAQTELRNITIDYITLGPPAPETAAAAPGGQRAGYCMPTAIPRPGQDPGAFVDLLRGQNVTDPTYKGAVPAFELADTGAIMCGPLPAGYKTTGQVDGPYPLASK